MNINTSTSATIADVLKLLPYRLKLGCLLSIFLILGCVSIPHIDMYIGLFTIYKNAKITPSVPSLIAYLDQKLLQGTHQSNVHITFQSLGRKVTITEFGKEGTYHSCDLIKLYIGIIPLNRLEYRVCYNVKNQLVYKSVR